MLGIKVLVKVHREVVTKELKRPRGRKRKSRWVFDAVDISIPGGQARFDAILTTAAHALDLTPDELLAMTATREGGELIGPTHVVMSACILELWPPDQSPQSISF